MSDDRRVVVTGLGIISGAGCDLDTFWQRVLKGPSCVQPITLKGDGAVALDMPIGVPVAFNASVHVGRKARKMDRAAQLVCASARDALADAQLTITDRNRTRVGVVIGSSRGPIEKTLDVALMVRESRHLRIPPTQVAHSALASINGNLSLHFGLRGPSYFVSTACASGTHALGIARDQIMLGHADVVVAGGTETPLNTLMYSMYVRLDIVSKRTDAPASAMRPFDRTRDGIALGEGAAVLILEELEHARKRGARIYAELAGYGAGSDAHSVAAMPADGHSLLRSIRDALQMAELNPQSLDYVNSHGTGTLLNDRVEVNVLKQLFDGKDDCPMSSTKPITGHCIGATGAMEALVSVLAIDRGILPPSFNYDRGDEENQWRGILRQAREARVNAVITNSTGFWGSNCCVVFKKAMMDNRTGGQ